ENTLEAFSHAVAVGADALEMDVRATADGSLVVIHDATVERTTDASGAVDALKLDQLQRLDAGFRWSADGGKTFPFRGKGVRIPTVDEVFARFPDRRVNLEIKNPPGAAAAKPLCDRIRAHRMQERMLVASMSDEAIAAFRGACPEVATSLATSEGRAFVFASYAWLDSAYTPRGVALQVPDRLRDRVLATPGLVKAAHNRNLKIHAWTVNDEARMRELVAIGIDGIITDRPDLLARIVGRGRL
ncbi:MAG TPA: glycerophosphodiester phosphodiesterase, partial [Burkholderiales bacterium]|nr:glycerophosphodiester phosphodiesterase [Burkholderiales bacterium]